MNQNRLFVKFSRDFFLLYTFNIPLLISYLKHWHHKNSWLPNFQDSAIKTQENLKFDYFLDIFKKLKEDFLKELNENLVDRRSFCALYLLANIYNVLENEPLDEDEISTGITSNFNKEFLSKILSLSCDSASCDFNQQTNQIEIMKFLKVDQILPHLTDISSKVLIKDSSVLSIASLAVIISNEEMRKLNLAFDITLNTISQLYEYSSLEEWYDLYLFNENWEDFDFEQATTNSGFSEKLLFNTSLIQLFISIVNHNAEKISLPEIWDWLQCSLISWLDILKYVNVNDSGNEKNINFKNSTKHFISALANLTFTLDRYLSSRDAISNPILPSNLCSDWTGFFKKQVYTLWLENYSVLSDSKNSKILQNIPNYSKLDFSNLQLKEFSKFWIKTVDTTDENEITKNTSCWLFENLLNKEKNFQTKIVKFDDFTNLYSFWSWRAITSLNLEIQSNDEKNAYFEMLNHLIEVMVVDVDSTTRNRNINQFLEKEWLYEENENENMNSKSSNFENMSKYCFYHLLKSYPSLARDWFLTKLSSKVGIEVKKFVSESNLSNSIITDIIKETVVKRNIHLPKKLKKEKSTSNLDPKFEEPEELTIKVSGDEISCIYRPSEDDDVKLELGIALPSDYPFSIIKVFLKSKSGTDNKRERAWILKLSMLLNKTDNLDIFDAINKWKKLVDTEFAGVEACAICYSVLCGESKQKPKIYCKQCNHKYHSKCIYKWFQSSNNNTCPLCRNPMVF